MPARRRSRGRRRSRRLDAGEGNAIPRAVFDRLVREIAWVMITDLNGRGDIPPRWQVAAVDAIQEAAESFAIELFEDALLCARHAGRQCTVNVEDVQLARRLRGYQRAS